MKNVFMLVAHQSKYEGTRTIVSKVIDNWGAAEEQLRADLDRIHGIVGGPRYEAATIWPIAALVKSLAEWTEADEEDQHIGLAHYLYQLWNVRAVVKHLTDPIWRLACRHWEEHFWYALGKYRGSTTECARKQLAIKLELSPLSFSEFIELVE